MLFLLGLLQELLIQMTLGISLLQLVILLWMLVIMKPEMMFVQLVLLGMKIGIFCWKCLCYWEVCSFKRWCWDSLCCCK